MKVLKKHLSFFGAFWVLLSTLMPVSTYAKWTLVADPMGGKGGTV